MSSYANRKVWDDLRLQLSKCEWNGHLPYPKAFEDASEFFNSLRNEKVERARRQAKTMQPASAKPGEPRIYAGRGKHKERSDNWIAQTRSALNGSTKSLDDLCQELGITKRYRNLYRQLLNRMCKSRGPRPAELQYDKEHYSRISE
jgi:hypothetical protein